MRIRRQAAAARLLPVFQQLIFGEPPFEKRARVNAGRTMRLIINQVAILPRAEKMVEPHFIQISGRRVGGNVPAEFGMFAVGTHHHHQRVPAYQCGDAFFQCQITGVGRLLRQRNGVAVSRGGVELQAAATAPRGVEQLLQNKLRARFALNGDQRLQRFHPLAGFLGIGVGDVVHG